MAAQSGGPKHLLFDKSIRPALEETLCQACGTIMLSGDSKRVQYDALTVWHNLAFSSEAKAYFSVNPDCLVSFLDIIDSAHPAGAFDAGSEESVILVLRILWALAHKSQKISLHLKKVGAQSYLQGLVESYSSVEDGAALSEDQNRRPSLADLSSSLMSVLRV